MTTSTVSYLEEINIRYLQFPVFQAMNWLDMQIISINIGKQK